jgi:hypothetical protein
MNDIETRLRDALAARADLVQPEHLTETAPPVEPLPWFRRPGGYLAVAAVAVLVIALPLLAVAVIGVGRTDEPPSGSPTVPDPVPTFRQPDHWTADVDGDGTDDDIRLVGERLEVALSTGGTVGTRATPVSIADATDLDGLPGAEIILADDRYAGFDTDVHGRVPIVVSLRDGALVEVLDYEFDVDPSSPNTLQHWWVEEGELRWWRTHEPFGGSLTYSVDLTRFPRAEQLDGVEDGTWCVKHTEPEQLFDCRGGTDAGDETDAGNGTPWYDEQPAGVPTVWLPEPRSDRARVEADVDGDGNADAISISDDSVDVRELSVDLAAGGRATAPLDGPALALLGPYEIPGAPTPVIIVRSAEGAAGSTYDEWNAWMVRAGELVALAASPEDAPFFGSQVSNLPPQDGGQPQVQTWHAEGGPGAPIYGMEYLDDGTVVTGHPDAPGEEVRVYRARFHQWRVEGDALRATTLGEGCVTPDVGQFVYGCPD